MAGGRRGRPPKPTALKVLEGNPGRRKLNKKEPIPDPAIPPMPVNLSQEAKEEWGRITPLLYNVGLLTEIDRTALEMYCQCYGRYIQAEQKISEQGLIEHTPSGYPIPNPYIGISNKAMQMMRGFLSEFGMSPATRTRVQRTDETEDDPMDAFLKITEKIRNSPQSKRK